MNRNNLKRPLCLLSLACYFLIAPIKTSGQSYQDLVITSEINGVNMFATDTFNAIVQNMLKSGKYSIDDSNDHPNVYFTNKSQSKYLKITGGPDLGYGWFYTIGYTAKGKCKDCGTYLGIQDAPDFVVDNDVKLGDDIQQVWQKAHLEYFRSFSYLGTKYYYFEKGVKHDVPFTPRYIYYYKFRGGKLSGIGFGYGMIGVNPMFNSK